MKKLLVMALGLGIVLGTVSFAQDTDKKMDDTKSTKKMKKSKKAKKGTDSTTSTDKKM